MAEGVSSGSEANTAEYRKAEEQLRNECEEVWQEIHQVQEVLLKETGSRVAVGENGLATIYTTKEALLKAQIEVMKNTNATAIPQSPVIQDQVMKADLSESIKQLEQTVAMMNEELEQMQEESDREEKAQKELNQVRQVLTEKLEEIQQRPQDEDAEHSITKLEKRERQAKIYYKQLIKQMAAFIQMHFPPPSAEQLQDFTKKRKGKGSETVESGSLKNLLEALMNKCLETPHDPYIAGVGHYWPPYIELLLRVGIALKHPENDSLIKLTPYHL